MGRSTLRNSAHEAAQFQWRVWALGFFVVAAFGVLVARFTWLQMLRHDYYLTQSDSNRIGIAPVMPNRGLILDRNGVILAHNYTAYTLEIRPDKAGDVAATIARIKTIIDIPAKDENRFYKLKKESRNFETLPLKMRLTDVEIARIAVQSYQLPGVEIKARLFREYPYKEITSHVIGYIARISQIDEDALEKKDLLSAYRGTTHMGKLGLEKKYESELHGITGVEEIETDSAGRAIRVLRRTAPISGNNLVLSLDIRLQQLADELFGDRRGALVAIDPNNGGILAFVSKPGFDPNLFIDGIDSTSYKGLMDNPFRPMTNRPLNGGYPPGSTFKPFMALAALEMGVRRPTDTIYDPGFFAIPGDSHHFRDDKAGGHGTVDMYRSIAASCDTYYYRLAYDMKIERIDQFMPKFKLGSKTGIDLEGESIGVLPSPEWKRQRFAGARYTPETRKWYTGDVISVGIGQGYNTYTPLQMANATAILASEGLVFQPHLVSKIQDVRTGTSRLVGATPVARHHFNPDNIAFIKRAMQGVVGPGGTGFGISANLEFTMAGKTGTAQVVGIKQGEKYVASRMKELHRDHSWFIAFAPVDKPKIALAVLVENGGFGATAAAPIARKMLDFYLLGKRPAEIVPPATTGKPTKPAVTKPEDAASDNGDSHD